MRRFWDKVVKGEPDACWLWTASKTEHGYGSIYFRGRLWKAHRVAWVLTRGEIPDGLWMLHSCDNPGCVNPAHLRPGTPKDNSGDMVARGRARPHLPGGRSAPKKLSIELAEEIRRARLAGEPQIAVARRFGITREHVRNIERGKSWPTSPPE